MTATSVQEAAGRQRPPEWFRETARQQGYGAALASLHREAGANALQWGPSGHAIASAETADQFATGMAASHVAGQKDRVTTAPLDGAGLVALRCSTLPPLPPSEYVPWALRLTWLRLGLSSALLDGCMEYLGGRTTGGEPLLKQQLLKGALADALIAHLEIETALAGGAMTVPDLADLNHDITLADRGLLRLLGARGFTLDGPGRSAYVSEMLADVYIGPAGNGASL